MVNRENYDPEDIEVLLQERTFDELLPEERAFVLRHLSGRAEYERLRALLGEVQRNERGHAPVVADAHVKDRVMDVFRAQRQPTWRVWLNTVHAFLLPKDTSALWRPALAFASIALLVTVSVLSYRNYVENEQAALAEVRREKAEVPVPKVNEPLVEEPVITEDASAEVADPEVAEAIEDVDPTGSVKENAPDAFVKNTLDVTTADAEILNMDDVAEEAPEMVRDENELQPAVPMSTGAVQSAHATADGAAMTRSVEHYSLSAVEVISAKRSAKKDRSKETLDVSAQYAMNGNALAATPELMALLQPGW